MNERLKRIILIPFNILSKISPALALKILFYIKQGYRLNLKNPRTYNEKLNWLKLNYRNDLMPICADKYTVRQYVKDCGLGHILNEIYWQGFDPNKIPFNNLPEKFVIKVTHGSGFNIICKNKNELNRKKVIAKLSKWLDEKYYPSYGEWFYQEIKPRIIVEKYLEDKKGNIPYDYKMFYFNNYKGKRDIAFTAIDINRYSNLKRVIYDNQWKKVENVYLNYPYEKSKDIKKPRVYKEMLEYAKVLAKPFPHVRVDFYIINNKIIFGELSFTNEAGFGKISPDSFSYKMGSWIKLPNKKMVRTNEDSLYN